MTCSAIRGIASHEHLNTKRILQIIQISSEICLLEYDRVRQPKYIKMYYEQE